MVEIKKLPPGEAYGARDLQNWSKRRLAGRDGSLDKKAFKKQKKKAQELSKLSGKKVKPFE